MKNLIAKFLCAAALLFAVAPAAKAVPIAGSIRISPAPLSGTTSFSATSITFNTPAIGQVDSQSTITGFGGLGYGGAMASLTSFTYANSNNVALFTTTNLVNTLTFTINGALSNVIYNPSFLVLQGVGTFTQTGPGNFDPTSGSFTLTASNTGIVSFEITSTAAVTPEPSSLLLLGTGLMGAAGMLMMRRRNAAAMLG